MGEGRFRLILAKVGAKLVGYVGKDYYKDPNVVVQFPLP
jgi:hypothetical protein